MKHICSNCGTIGKPKTIVKGTFLIEVVLWLFLIVPGIIYTLWRVSTKYKGCSTCDSKNIVPLDSPRGKELNLKYSKT